MNKDEIREQILKVLFDKQENSRSRSSSLMGIRDLARGVKDHLPSSKEQDVASSVLYLVQNGFVEEVAVENYFAKSKFGGAKPSYKYRLTRDGLAYFEHDSKFDKGNVFAGIGSITGDGNVIVVGSANNITNLVNNRFAEGHRLAEDLRRKINALGELSDSEKINLQSDIETIKSQLSKEEPDESILSKAKENLSVLADLATVAPYAVLLFEWLSKTFGIS